MSRGNITQVVGLTLFPAHSGLESRAHTNPTSLSSVHGVTLIICPVFYSYGSSRVVLPKVLEGLLFGSRSRGAGGRGVLSVPGQGCFVLRQCGNYTPEAAFDVQGMVILEMKEKRRV
jgi:hypothetical protein